MDFDISVENEGKKFNGWTSIDDSRKKSIGNVIANSFNYSLISLLYPEKSSLKAKIQYSVSVNFENKHKLQKTIF